MVCPTKNDSPKTIEIVTSTIPSPRKVATITPALCFTTTASVSASKRAYLRSIKIPINSVTRGSAITAIRSSSPSITPRLNLKIIIKVPIRVTGTIKSIAANTLDIIIFLPLIGSDFNRLNIFLSSEIMVAVMNVIRLANAIIANAALGKNE